MARSRGSTGGDAVATPEISNPQASRETVESIVVAVILAFLFRAFVAEAFVIPTGSMAPTLQGRHLDLNCVQCGYQYRTGASMENEGLQQVDRVTCPICRYQRKLKRSSPRALLWTNEDSFSGDRILVSKFAYELSDPERWDIIVFKYPGNAKQNYIKRLVGLPGETIWIQNGDIFIVEGDQIVQGPETHGGITPGDLRLDDLKYSIARKSPSKVRALLQLVDDTKYIGERLLAAGWPSRWDQGIPTEDRHRWQIGAAHQQFTVSAGEQESWLHYRHLLPRPGDWDSIDRGELPDDVKRGSYNGQLITDYYAYNDFSRDDYSSYEATSSVGNCWVGDLSVVCDVELQSATGELLLELIEGGVRYRCRIDVAGGLAELTIGDGSQPFVDSTGVEVARPTGATGIRGVGRHRLQFANVDDQLLLWVDSKLVGFDGPTTYLGDELGVPANSADGVGDLTPVGLGGRNVDLRLTRLQVLRDVYYQAVRASERDSEYDVYHGNLREAFSNPALWANLFAKRRAVVFPLAEDQFFPLGDNSPQSKDARLWTEGYPPGPEPYVERRLLLGKALLIYWPHRWRPFLPNFARMGVIR
jgi:signal peptidase I